MGVPTNYVIDVDTTDDFMDLPRPRYAPDGLYLDGSIPDEEAEDTPPPDSPPPPRRQPTTS